MLRVLCTLMATLRLTTSSFDIHVVNTATGQRAVVSMNANAKVQDLKRALKWQLPIAELARFGDSDLLFDLFSLSFKGTTLEDDATLGDLRIGTPLQDAVTLTESGFGAYAVVEVQTGIRLFGF